MAVVWSQSRRYNPPLFPATQSFQFLVCTVARNINQSCEYSRRRPEKTSQVCSELMILTSLPADWYRPCRIARHNTWWLSTKGLLISSLLFNISHPWWQASAPSTQGYMKPLSRLSNLNRAPSNCLISPRPRWHCHPEGSSSFICLVPARPHSSLSPAIPRLRPCCFLFTNKSPSCDSCLDIQTRGNNNAALFMILRGGRAWKQHQRRRKMTGMWFMSVLSARSQAGGT